MSRRIQGRRTGGKDLRRRPFDTRREVGSGKIVAAARRGHSSPRLIGLPLGVTIPKLKDIRWRYCTRWDEQPAAQLGKSLVRLGICEASDWSGSAVDFVDCGFKRFCLRNGAEDAARIWAGNLRIMDHAFELIEQERQQVVGEMDAPPQLLYMVGEFSAAASIPIGPTWPLLEREHPLLPAAFYRVLVDNLWKWMRVYDYQTALDHAEMWMDGLDEEELRESFYPKVREKIPVCLRNLPKLRYSRARHVLEEIQPRLRGSIARQLVAHVLALHEHGKGHDHAWPGKLAEQVPAIEDFLNDADGCGPGCVITWHEDDEISACFDEDMSTLGQNGPAEPSTMLMIRLDQHRKSLDAEVKRVLNYAGAMLRSLAEAAKAVEIIREVYDEQLRKHRIQSRVPIEPGTPGLREEQP